jgi:uncharacterized protein
MDGAFLFFQLFGTQDFLGTNLIIILVLRIIYWITLTVRFKAPRESDGKSSDLASFKKKDREKIFNDIEKRGFILKEILIIGLGILHINFVILIGLYSSLLIGFFSLENMKIRKNGIAKILNTIAFGLFGSLLPIGLIIYGSLFYQTYLVQLLFGLVGILAFIIAKGYKIPKQMKKPFSQQYAKFDIISSSKRIKVGLIICLCLVPSAFLLIKLGHHMEMQMVPMRDSTKLSTRIYKPYFSNDPMPVILLRTPYNQDGLESSANRWASKGYIVVTQDFRGTYYSDGVFQAFMSCATDGYDTIKWISEQPWCNGKIATIGMSAGAINQYLSAGEKSPGLVAQHLDMGAPEIYDDLFYTGGKWRKALAENWITLTAGNSLYFNKKPLNNATDMISEFLNHWEKDNWYNNASLSLNNKYANVSVRALHFGGWYDIFAQGTLDGYIGYSNNGSTYALNHQKLVIGPYTHGSRSGPCGEINFPNASYGTQIADQWRDEIFAESIPPVGIYSPNVNSNLWQEPNVLFYMMGDVLDTTGTGNRWIYADTWPVTNTPTPYYFQENGSLSVNKASGPKTFSYNYDPENPVGTLGGQNLVLAAGIMNQASLISSRSDILTFNSSILTSPLEIAGPLKVKLWVSSNCTDTDFTAKLTDVYPNGYNALINDGIINVRKRNGLDKDELITPGSIYEVEIDLWSTAYQFNTGHQIQVSISSSNYPKWDICPNSGVAYSNSYNTTNDALNTIYVSTIHDSYIELPVYKA